MVSEAGGSSTDVVRLAHDVWESARDGSDWTKPYPATSRRSGSASPAIAHKELVSMRGRMYDPWSARLVNPDPIAAPHSVQGHNRMTPIVKKHRVAVVLDECFGQRIFLLAQRIHVWMVESPENEEYIEDLLKVPVDADADPLASGFTIFEPEGDSRLEILLNVMEDIEDHHGEYAHDPAWTEMEIYGLAGADADAVRRSLADYMVIGARATAFGVEAWRAAPSRKQDS